MSHEEEGNRPYEKRVPITEEERRTLLIQKLAVTDALNSLFTELGINRANVEVMEELREDLRFLRGIRKRKGIYNDLEFLNSTRTGFIKAGGRFMMVVVTIMATAFVGGMILGFKAWLEVLLATKPH